MARRQAFVLLAVALMLGAGLRFYRLGTADLSADEAASWAGAAEPDLRAVVERQHRLDPGKLAIYDLALHGWIGIGGDSAGSMRALSALLGTIAIWLIFVATRELSSLGAVAAIRRAEFGAAFAALVAAVNLTLIDQSRTVRMYPLTLVLELAQVVCFLRAASVRARSSVRIASLGGTAIFSALAIAANFTAGLLIAAEAMWLAWTALLRRRGTGAGAACELYLAGPALALCVGMALLGPIAPMAGRNSIALVRAGVLNWSHLRPPWWPLGMLRSASGKVPFLFLLPLAAYGGLRMRRDGEGAALGFVLWWTLAPIAIVMAVSYTFTPFEETRYVISSAVAFFILAGIGLAAIGDTRLRVALLVLIAALSLDHVRRDFIKPQYVQWREATALALAADAGRGPVAVVPGYAVNVVRYYSPPGRRADVERAAGQCEARQRVLMLDGKGSLTSAQLAALQNCNPRVVKRLRLVEVRTR
jgi:hypothetical protein